MPATHESTASRRRDPLRVVGAGLLIAFALTVGTPDVPAVEATNWSRQIGATRASQLYYEGAMRAADQQIASLKRARKHTHRRLVKARHSLSRLRHRASDHRERLTRTRTQLRMARTRLELAERSAALITPSIPMGSPAGSADITLATDLAGPTDPTMLDDPTGPADLALEVRNEPADTSVHDASNGPPLASLSGLVPALGIPQADPAAGITGSEPGMAPPSPAVGPAALAVRQLERTERSQQRASQKAARKVRRTKRAVRARSRSLAAIKRGTGAAISRREGAEAGLGSNILAMSALAQRRVAKKTNVRPGINSGFSWPTRGRISQGYGCTGFHLNPPRGSCRHFHDGVDIVSYQGSPIRSAAVGVVSYIGWNPWDQHGRAFMVVVAHPGGFETLYGHVLPTRQVRVGQFVRRGEVIGYMGNTGRSTGVHLHLELRRGRTTLSPLAFL